MSPVTSHGAITESAAGGRWRRGGAFTSTAMTPLARKTQTISDSVQAVTTVLTPNSTHNSASFASVIRTSFTALRPMIAMTAAPIP